jgi:hypothetical protein
MEMKKRLKSITVVGLAVFLTAFSGQEKFVELEGYLNGRTSAKFRKIDTNVQAILSSGTRGEIMESKKMSSGNYGLRVKVLSGKYTGRSYWIYYNNSNPDMKLFSSPPQSWNDVEREQVKKVEEAAGVETTRPVKGIDDTEKNADRLYKETQPKADNDAQDALDAIQAGTEAIKNIPIPSARPDCVDCSKNPQAEVEAEDGDDENVVIGRGAIPMNQRCSMFIDRNGKFGRLGNKAMDMMAEQKYIQLFTNSNALGDYCPKFNSLSNAEKLQAWTWYWTSLANEETQCVVDIEHPEFDKKGNRINNRPGWGLFAAEKRDKDRAFRGAPCRDIKTDVGQLRCAIDTMATYTLGEGQNAHNDKGTYWGPTQPYMCVKNKKTGKVKCGDRGARQIMPHMKRFQACF